MTCMCDTPAKVKNSSSIQTVKKATKWKECLTASIVCLSVVLIWVAGFKYTSIHSAMATLSLLVVLPFPFSIIWGSDAV